MAWRARHRRIDGAVRDRLDRLAREWTIPPAGPPAATPSAQPAPEVDERGWSPRAVRALAVLLATGVLVAGWWWWSGRPREVLPAPAVAGSDRAAEPAADTSVPAGESPDAGDPGAAPTASPSAVVVHVAGLVARPGLVTLPAGARVADAIDAAGGVTRPRAADSVNLARVLVDGEQVVVTDDPPVAAAASGAPAQVDLNTADASALEDLPGVGPVLAERILAWRAEHGRFRTVDELGEVAGIGESVLAGLRSRVRV